jgi:MscS family membrane protein
MLKNIMLISDNYLPVLGKAALILAIAVLIAWLLGRLWDIIAGRLAARSKIELYKNFVNASHRYLVIMIFLVSLRLFINYISPELGTGMLGTLDKLFYTVMVFVLALLADMCVHIALDWYSRDFSAKTQGSLEQFLPLIRQLARLLIYFIAFTFILEYFGKNITGLIATAGVASLAIALAAQETLSNMIAGLMLMLDRPFRPGDRIELDKGLIGDVIQIGTRTTRILNAENSVIVVPNKDLANSRIVNHVFPTPRTVVNMEVGVAFDSDINIIKDLLKDILANKGSVLADPPPGVLFASYSSSALKISVSFWIADFRERAGVVDEINMSIKEGFEKAGIEMPFPRNDIYLLSDERCKD